MIVKPTSSSPNAVNTDFPMPQTPLIDANGNMSNVWWRYLMAIFNRTGGAGNPPAINDVSKSVTFVSQNNDDLSRNFNAMAIPTLAAALIQRVAALEVMIQGFTQVRTTAPQVLPDMVQPTIKASQILPEPVSILPHDQSTNLYKYLSK